VKPLPHKKFAPVSVVVPCYECSNTIERAVGSIVAQTLIPKEVILVDDATHDGTWQKLQALQASYSGWIKIFRLAKNQGAASARNTGWSKVTQPYLAFLDADDSWHPEKINIQFNYMISHPKVDLSGHLYLWNDTSEFFLPVVGAFGVSKVSAHALLFKSYFPTPSVMLKSDMPLRFREAQRYSEDAFLWQQLALGGGFVVRLDIPLVMLHKAPYGAGGLSAQLIAMERGELNNLLIHYQNKKISFLLFLFAVLWSAAKFHKRLLIRSLCRWL